MSRTTSYDPTYLTIEAKRILSAAMRNSEMTVSMFSTRWHIDITADSHGRDSVSLVARAYRAGTLVFETSEKL